MPGRRWLIDKDAREKRVSSASLFGVEDWVKIEVTINISLVSPSSHRAGRAGINEKKTLLKCILDNHFPLIPPVRRPSLSSLSPVGATECTMTRKVFPPKKTEARFVLCSATRIEEITFVSFFCQTFSTQFQLRFINYRWLGSLCLWKLVWWWRKTL